MQPRSPATENILGRKTRGREENFKNKINEGVSGLNS
jgi:hypothetical protein